MENKKILIIEDDEFLRQLCVKKMKQEKYEIVTAINGKEGYEKIISETPDLVLMDVIMPDLDGFEVLGKIRSHENEKVANTPIIMLTNLGQETDIEKARKLKATDYLVKANFTTEEIAEKIKGFLEQ